MISEYQLSFFDLEQQEKNVNRYVRRIDYDDTKPFLLGIHYARRMPCITDAFGLFVDGDLIGVVTYGIPASPNLCEGLAGEKNRNKVLELNRLVLLPDKNKMNNASYLVSHSLKLLQYIYIYIFVVSYADTAWGHIGYVYQATNFLYIGMSAKRTDVFIPNGKHARHTEGLDPKIRQTRSPKHRYVYLVGDKRDKKRMLRELKYPIVSKYPKGNEVRYNPENPVPVIPIQVMGDDDFYENDGTI